MGGEIKRVALDFSWPMSKTWDGFLNPHYRECPESDKTCFNGQTAARSWINAIVRFMDTLANDARNDCPARAGVLTPHPYIVDFQQAPHTSKPRELTPTEATNRILYGHDPSRTVRPGKEFVEFFDRLAKRNEPYHMNLTPWEAEKNLIRAAGYDPESYGACQVCGGENIDPACKEAYDAWTPTEPPAGEGWQVWETVSDGSPITPVFPTAEALIDYICTVGDDWTRKDMESGGGNRKLPTRKQAEAFVKAGWVPSAMMGPDGFKRDIECAS